MDCLFCAIAAGDTASAREALTRAVAEVRRKARRIRDEGWRARYLAAPPAARKTRVLPFLRAVAR